MAKRAIEARMMTRLPKIFARPPDIGMNVADAVVYAEPIQIKFVPGRSCTIVGRAVATLVASRAERKTEMHVPTFVCADYSDQQSRDPQQ